MNENESSASGIPTGQKQTNDQCTRQYDWQTNDTPSYAVLATVASAADRDPAFMEPLYEVIDPEAVDKLFDPPLGDARQSAGLRISFRYMEYDVSVYDDGHVTIEAADENEQ